jgi:hypothetical protein
MVTSRLCARAVFWLELRCLNAAARLAAWHGRLARPSTPPDHWPAIRAALIAADAPPIVGFCCGQVFTSEVAHFAHVSACRATFAAPVVFHRDPNREARA